MTDANNIIRHYDLLIDLDNDPVHDPPELRAYMDCWDGQPFVDLLELTPEKSALEIGIGTGRLAMQTAPLCRDFCGIDLSPKTVERARANLAGYRNVTLICGDFMSHAFAERFDVIYSSLTFMHIPDKQAAVSKAATLLNPGGRFVLSLDKNQASFIDIGVNRIAVYPDDPEKIAACLASAGLKVIKTLETEHAYILAAVKS